MTDFTFHDLESAPAESRAALEGAQRALGFIPSLYAGLVESPAALKAYLTLSDILAESSLSPTEQQTVLLAVSVENGCEFCVAAHSVIARNMVKVESPVVDALRGRDPIPDPKLEALAQFARALVQDRGWVQGPALDAFLAAGFGQRQVLDVIVAVAMKTLSNYANHVLQTPTDEAFASEAWSRTG